MHGANYANKYCNNQCQQDHRRRQLAFKRVEEWKSGGNLYVWRDVPEYIKTYLLGLRGHQCQVCGIEVWCGKPAPLTVTQIDSDPYNTKEENLQIICYNCKALSY